MVTDIIIIIIISALQCQYKIKDNDMIDEFELMWDDIEGPSCSTARPVRD